MMEKSMLKKGDTIELKNELVIIVLNDGIKGKEFVYRYENKTIQHFNSPSFKTHRCTVTCFWIMDPFQVEEVYYCILIGDEKGWIEERILTKHLQYSNKGDTS